MEWKKAKCFSFKSFGEHWLCVYRWLRTKLDDKSKQMIFLGYEQKSKWYKFYNPNKGNMMISRDVEFNEEGAWNWKVDDGEKYDFLPILDEKEERYEDHQEPIVSPLQTPMSSTFSPPSSLSSFSSFSSSSSRSWSSGTPPSLLRKMRSLDDLYEVTNHIDNDVKL